MQVESAPFLGDAEHLVGATGGSSFELERTGIAGVSPKTSINLRLVVVRLTGDRRSPLPIVAES